MFHFQIRYETDCGPSPPLLKMPKGTRNQTGSILTHLLTCGYHGNTGGFYGRLSETLNGLNHRPVCIRLRSIHCFIRSRTGNEPCFRFRSDITFHSNCFCFFLNFIALMKNRMFRFCLVICNEFLNPEFVLKVPPEVTCFVVFSLRSCVVTQKQGSEEASSS